ncbi:baseplate J/gp47 family protein [Tenacibaculum jejuense]|uniref:Uncharacterized protein n=1 Tax=Tenacibaculum jejuense TaxID=584609 RepID=A0A238UEM3_9FLAO|nr:baseplate J/gp47 family protein [Tenacibaculum jejuense]SNR16924.1 protein of unknown function [Tenacibaculum jejuense]
MNSIEKFVLLRDGASKYKDNLSSLNTSNLAIDNSTVESLISEAQKIAKELLFFNHENTPVSTWESFLIEDSETYFKASETGKKALRKQWAKQLATYINNPDHFKNDTNTLEKLTQPHTVLFLTFLKLLDHIRNKMNSLTGQHLDFYFKKCLQLVPQKAIPDVVNILVELTENTEALEIEAGTVFLAGEDEDGNELQYKATENTILNQAKVASLQSVFVDKQEITIQKAHMNAVEDPDKGLLKMFELALGVNNPGDELPTFSTIATDWENLCKLVKEGNSLAENYVVSELFLRVEDFIYIIEKHETEKNHTTANWDKTYELLTTAYIDKIKKNRADDLHKIQEESDFNQLTKHIFGFPNSGDKLPLYNGKIVTFSLVYEDLKDAIKSQKAKDYITDELLLTVEDFVFIIETSTEKDPTVEVSKRYYQILEQSERRFRSIIISPPSVEKIKMIYGAEDITKLATSLHNTSEESKQFKIFGSISGTTKEPEIANLGFAISSPLLFLKEGKRKIFLNFQFSEELGDGKQLEKLLKKGFFNIQFSGEETWFQSKRATEYSISYDVKPDAERVLINDFKVVKEDPLIVDFYEPGVVFIKEEENIDKYIVNIRNEIYQILDFPHDSSLAMSVVYIGQLPGEVKEPFMFTKNDLQIGLNLELILSEDEPPVTTNSEATNFVNATTPTLLFLVNQDVVLAYENENGVAIFQELMALTFSDIKLRVSVDGMKNVMIQNDQTTLNNKKTFELFGGLPEVGSNFYFGHEEISQKPIQSLQIETNWGNQPESFTTHYENYWKVSENSLTPSVDQIPITSNSDFKIKLFLHDESSEIPVTDELSLFTADNKIAIQNIPELLKETRPGYVYRFKSSNEFSNSEITDWKRYFRLELDPIDFQHQLYNQLLIQQAFGSKEIQGLVLNPPYLPKLKKISIGYTAETNILTNCKLVSEENKLSHIHPFGYKELTSKEHLSLLPDYQDNGSLLIGLSNIIPSQTVSVLFQMAEGSANPDVERPELKWSYLKEDIWIPLESKAIISDTTNGLLNTGIIRVQLPADATKGNTLLSNELHWLKVSVSIHIDGVSDIIAVKSQVVNAVLSNTVVASSHFQKPLQSESIQETQAFIPEIETISQPFTSSQGRPAEALTDFNYRISKRLRHKNRALTMWDYEHMILDRFPEVYKVKCLPDIKTLGKVNITVVPDIRKSLPFNPFQPKVGADVLERIHQVVEKHAPAYASIHVKNPTYLKVSTRCSVKFCAGYDEIFYQSKLINEIKQFLSPWAYGETEHIRLGGTLDAGKLINFIAERPYVDFVAKLKMFQSVGNQSLVDVTSVNNGENIVIPNEPDMVIVSDEIHVIDIVDGTDYVEGTQRGINYMIVERDFTVAKDLLKTEE